MPTKRSFQQGSSEWKSWRMRGIGASDAPVIMGVSPWTTVEELWLLKTGRRSEAEPNFAMRRGSALEAEARSLYVDTYGIEVSPTCFEHSKHRWMRASLDGWSEDDDVVVEIKCPGFADHQTAESGDVPDKYFPQLQHLLAVSGASTCHYVSYRRGEIVLLEVEPDEGYMEELFEAELAFWDCVRGDIPL